MKIDVIAAGGIPLRFLAKTIVNMKKFPQTEKAVDKIRLWCWDDDPRGLAWLGEVKEAESVMTAMVGYESLRHSVGKKVEDDSYVEDGVCAHLGSHEYDLADEVLALVTLTSPQVAPVLRGLAKGARPTVIVGFINAPQSEQEVGKRFAQQAENNLKLVNNAPHIRVILAHRAAFEDQASPFLTAGPKDLFSDMMIHLVWLWLARLSDPVPGNFVADLFKGLDSTTLNTIGHVQVDCGRNSVYDHTAFTCPTGQEPTLENNCLRIKCWNRLMPSSVPPGTLTHAWGFSQDSRFSRRHKVELAGIEAEPRLSHLNGFVDVMAIETLLIPCLIN